MNNGKLFERKNVVCILFIMLVHLSLGTENNAVSYWNERGNILFDQGNVSGAIYCYNRAINLGDLTNAPIFGEIVVQSVYRMDALDNNNSTQVFSKICSEPTSSILNPEDSDSECVSLCFDVSNPNNMHMRIDSIYINVTSYNCLKNPKIIKNFGIKKTIGYICNIGPEMASYRCIPTLSNGEFIDLAPGELEHIELSVRTDVPGIYEIEISMNYAIGSETGTIIVGDMPKLIGFFDNCMISRQPQ